MVAVGIPDLILHHRGLERAGWFEVKKLRRRGYDPRNRGTWFPEPLKPDQVAFRLDCLATGQLHGWGAFREAEAWLVGLELGFWSAPGLFTMGRPRR